MGWHRDRDTQLRAAAVAIPHPATIPHSPRRWGQGVSAWILGRKLLFARRKTGNEMHRH